MKEMRKDEFLTRSWLIAIQSWSRSWSIARTTKKSMSSASLSALSAWNPSATAQKFVKCPHVDTSSTMNALWSGFKAHSRSTPRNAQCAILISPSKFSKKPLKKTPQRRNQLEASLGYSIGRPRKKQLPTFHSGTVCIPWHSTSNQLQRQSSIQKRMRMNL